MVLLKYMTWISILKIKIIKVDGIEFMIQSYLKNKQAHLVSVIERYSIIISLENLRLGGSYGKQDSDWKEFCKPLNIQNIKIAIEEIKTLTTNNNDEK